MNTAFLDVCAGRIPDRNPVWLMRQAGRYLPEYREVRSRVSFLELCRTPQLAAEVTVQPIDRLDVDAAILFSDILVVLEAMGVEVRFEPGPVVPAPVRTEADAKALHFDGIDEIRYVFDAVAACKRALDDRVPLIGFAGAPFTVLSYLIEGGSSRDFLEVKRLVFGEPVLFGHLMDQLVTLTASYLVGQVDAGADAVQVFDSWAGALGPQDYEEHVLPHNIRLVSLLQENFSQHAPGTPVIFFARGNANILQLNRRVPSDVLGIDWSIGLGDAVDVVGRDRIVQGNLDPGFLLAPPDAMRARIEQTVREGRAARGHVFNLGHGISKHTDPQMAKLMVETVHAQPVTGESGAGK